jgi:hypothetical protein
MSMFRHLIRALSGLTADPLSRRRQLLARGDLHVPGDDLSESEEDSLRQKNRPSIAASHSDGALR